MSKTISVEFKVSVRLDVGEEHAANITREDLEEMAFAAVGHHHGGKAVQLICDGKGMWTKPYVHGEMKSEDAEFVDVYVESEDFDFEITDVDDGFDKVNEGRLTSRRQSRK